MKKQSKKSTKNKEPKKEGFFIPKKAMYGVAPAIAIIAILLSKGRAPEVLLFLVGISVGILIGRGYFEKD